MWDDVKLERRLCFIQHLRRRPDRAYERDGQCGEHDVPVIARSQMSAAKASEPVGMLKSLGWRNMMSRIVAPIGVAFGDNSSAEAISLAGLIHGRAAQRSQRPSLKVRRA
jgi:hypothetical protein